MEEARPKQSLEGWDIEVFGGLHLAPGTEVPHLCRITAWHIQAYLKRRWVIYFCLLTAHGASPASPDFAMTDILNDDSKADYVYVICPSIAMIQASFLTIFNTAVIYLDSALCQVTSLVCPVQCYSWQQIFGVQDFPVHPWRCQRPNLEVSAVAHHVILRSIA